MDGKWEPHGWIYGVSVNYLPAQANRGGVFIQQPSAALGE